jgi:ribosome biogenesis protein MAK21
MKSRLLSALLTGVNRAHPYLPRQDAAMEQHIDALYRISHTAPAAAATQALMLLFQLSVGSGEEAHDAAVEDGGKKRGIANNKEEESVTARKDRFYRALYSKLGTGEMFSGRQLTLFFNLLYKAMKYDDCTERICAFAKRLMNTVLHQSPSIICGTLFLLSEIIKCHPEILALGPNGTDDVSTFDPSKREPRAAFGGKGASLSKSLWELSLLVHHFHPSVNKFAIHSEGEIAYAGDPLKDFALAPFLDKFAFRNPKALKAKKESIAAGRKTSAEKVMGLPMNDPSFLEAENIPAEEKFFHQFFVERAKRDEMKGIIRGSGDAKDRNDGEDEAMDAAEKVADAVSFLSYIVGCITPIYSTKHFLLLCSFVRTLIGAM